MGRVAVGTTVSLPPAEALELWTDVGRWRSFVDGFAHAVEVAPHWPTEGAKVVWESLPGGRGRVSERVEDYGSPPPGPEVAVQSGAGRLVTAVHEDSLEGRQSASFAPAAAGTRVELELAYELTRGGPLRGVTDVLFIRRALRDSLRRTLTRFAAEAAGEGGSG